MKIFSLGQDFRTVLTTPNTLGLHSRERATRLDDNAIHEKENRVEFPEERAFVFVIQHGCRDVRSAL